MGKRTWPLDRKSLPRRPASRSRLFTVDVETGVLRVLFNEATSWGLVRRLFLKLDTLMYLASCSVVHRGLPLPFLFWLDLVCAVLWREQHTALYEIFSFLAISSLGIAFICQNKNKLTSFSRKLCVSGHFMSVIKPTTADAPDTQLV